VQRVLAADLKGATRGGRYTVEATLKAKGKTLCSNAIRFTVVEQPALENPKVAVVKQTPELMAALKAVGAQHFQTTNSTCMKDDPFLFVGRDIQQGGPSFEGVQQVSRMVRLGGVAVIFRPETPVFYDSLLPKPIRLMSPMRTINYIKAHPMTEGLPAGILAWELIDLKRSVHHVAEDIKALRGQTIIGGIGSNMWTKPDIYHWTGMLDEVPVGRGKVILVQLDLLANVKKNPAARRLLRNILAYARDSIRPGLEANCMGRCIDPITAP
jgi:hypothetical protein